jgi:hypothetical protein
MNLGKFDCATGLSNQLYEKGDLTVRTSTKQGATSERLTVK